MEMEKPRVYRISKKAAEGIRNLAISSQARLKALSNLKDLKHKIGKGTVDFFSWLKKEPLSFTYPILGNLSREVQERIENLTGGYYNAINASMTSAAVNMLTHLVLTGAMFYQLSDKSNEAIFGSTMGGLYVGGALGGLEFFYRAAKMEGKTMKEAWQCSQLDDIEYACGSLIGKIASLPLEAMIGFYDGVRGK